jgi:hypothetical protein
MNFARKIWDFLFKTKVTVTLEKVEPPPMPKDGKTYCLLNGEWVNPWAK